MHIKYSDAAKQDLENIFDYIYAESTYYNRAQNYVQNIIAHCIILTKNPYAGKQQDFIKLGVRSLVFKKTYHIFYTVEEDHISIITIIDTSLNHLELLL